MKPALNQNSNVSPLQKIPFVGKIFSGLHAGSRISQILLGGVGTLVVAGGVFTSLKLYEKKQRKVFAASGATLVELPKSIKKQDLQNLTPEQQEKLDQQINAKIKAQTKNITQPQNEQKITIVVLTQNGQPILPDLNQGASGTSQEAVPTATSAPSSREEPTATLTPSATPTAAPLPPCSDSDGGENFFIKGTVTTPYGNQLTDYCTSTTTLGEYFCMPDLAFYFQNITCPGRCVDGACIPITPTPTPSLFISPTKAPSPTITPTPTNVPCTDTDGGKDIYVKGTVMTWGKSYTDVCYSLQSGEKTECSDYFCRLLEYSCQPQGYQGEGFTCQYGCKNGACIKTSPSPTITPGGPRCVDTDSQNQLNVKGTIYIDGQPKVSDHCQLSWWDEQRHYWDYKFAQNCPAHSNDNYYSSTNNPAGSKADRCMISEAKCASPASDQYYGTTAYCSGGCNDGACFMGNEIKFSYSSEAEQKYKEKYQSELKSDVEKIYQEAKKIFGLPFKNINVSITVCDSEYYDVSTNRICFDDQNVPLKKTLVSLILSAFHDELAYFLPENWAKGMKNVAMIEINRNLFDQNFSGLGDQVSTYEILNLTKAYASQYGNLYSGELFNEISYLSLASGALLKPYLEDNQFLANLNKAIYSQAVIDNTLKDKILGLAASVKGTVEGESSAAWLARQYILQVNSQTGNYLMFYLGRETPYQPTFLKIKAMQVFADGTKKGTNGLAIEAGASNFGHVRIWTMTKNTAILNGQDGRVDFETPKGSGADQGFPAGYTGPLNFGVPVTNYNSPSFCYPYRNGEAVKIDGQQGLFGCFQDRTTGELKAKAGGNTYNKTLENGNFAFPELKDYRGQIELSYTDAVTNREVKKNVTKMMPDYYTSLFVGYASQNTRGAPISPGTNCTDGWQDYEDENFKLKFKIPPGWTDNSIDEHQSGTFIYRHLISTDTPEQQLDPKYKVSYFDILASTSDLKDSDYGSWLKNNTGNQQKTPVDFKGIAAEKYTDDTQMPCASQTEEGAACNYHSEIYYFEKDDIYYLLSLGIYTSPDVKEQNEANLKCFLENFALSGQEETVGGMKLFTSQRLQFKIRYPAELFAYEWPSDYKPNFNSEKPDSDRNVVQFFKNKDLSGEKITIRRDTNPQRKTAKDFAKAYWSASEESLKHWKPRDVDFVVYTAKVQGGGEEKTYFTPLGDWMYIFDGSDAGLQSALEKMLPTLEFLGSGEAFSDLIPCPDDLYSTSEQLKEQQEEWWTKPDRCNSQPEKKVCGYIRSIYDNGKIQVGSQDYRNAYCYCSFFEKNGSRTYRGTEMFALGYKEGACSR